MSNLDSKEAGKEERTSLKSFDSLAGALLHINKKRKEAGVDTLLYIVEKDAQFFVAELNPILGLIESGYRLVYATSTL